MIRERDPLADAFAHLRGTEIDPRLASRTLARARAELTPAARPTPPIARLWVAVVAALVPALLLSAAAAHFVETAHLAAKIYGHAGGRG